MAMTNALPPAALAASGLLKVLSEDGRARLMARGLEAKLAPEETLFQKGEPGDALYVVIEGEVEVGVATEGGRHVRFAALGAGAVLGELAALDGGPRSADARASRRTRLWKIPREALLEAIAAEPQAALALLAELAGRVRKADQAIEAAVLLDLPGKVAKLLLEESANGARVVALNQTEMARRISVSREKLNRRLHLWADEGVVDITRSGVKVLAPERLTGFLRRRETD